MTARHGNLPVAERRSGRIAARGDKAFKSKELCMLIPHPARRSPKLRHFARGMLMVAAAACSGCGSRKVDLPSGAEAYALFPASASGAATEYVIGPFDELNLTVFQEPDLSLREVQVDASGNVLLPLVGTVTAAGNTATQLAKSIEEKLGARFLVNPQVTVTVTTSVSQKVTVSGSVTEPGVFQIQGEMTLLDAVALAKGVTRTAATNQTIVFRTIDGQRAAALFNLDEIEEGKAENPIIKGNDRIVVLNSAGKALFRDVVATLPAVGVFAFLR